ncbi:spore coat protein CotJB [Bacillus rhizoplanae]|uniref:spore coat protein CotJB n=1 Tax=Bacillus rhizoplanae TaxID=2880966 RepID=UPI003D197D59
MSRQELLREIQETEFVLLEIQLFLDTHPSDMDALKQFNELSFSLNKLKSQFEIKFGPLLGFGFSKSRKTWKWINEPWPWQIEIK